VEPSVDEGAAIRGQHCFDAPFIREFFISVDDKADIQEAPRLQCGDESTLRNMFKNDKWILDATLLFARGLFGTESDDDNTADDNAGEDTAVELHMHTAATLLKKSCEPKLARPLPGSVAVMSSFCPSL
jgi:hypothetical protein